MRPFSSGREEGIRREKSRSGQKASVNRGPKRAKVSRHKRKTAVREGKKGKGRKIKAGARREGSKTEATAQKRRSARGRAKKSARKKERKREGEKTAQKGKSTKAEAPRGAEGAKGAEGEKEAFLGGGERRPGIDAKRCEEKSPTSYKRLGKGARGAAARKKVTSGVTVNPTQWISFCLFCFLGIL